VRSVYNAVCRLKPVHWSSFKSTSAAHLTL